LPSFSVLTPEFRNRFRKNRRGYYSLLILIAIFIASLCAEIIANDKPLILSYKGKIYLPIFQKISEKELGGELLSQADFQDPWLQEKIYEHGWILFAPNRFSFDSINFSLKKPSPAAPNLFSRQTVGGSKVADSSDSTKQSFIQGSRRFVTSSWLGTDDQGRDVFSRLIYGVRISLIFGLILSFFSLVIGICLGAIQGYFGGLLDLFLQRFIEIWSSLPVMFLLIIFSAIITPTFATLLILMLLFSWLAVVSYVRAEFLRLRNFDFVIAAKAKGASNLRIIFRHILPNAAPIIIANLPFLVAESITTLTALDFLGLGLPVGSPSLGELLAQGKNNLNCPWLVIVGFLSITIILTLLVFIGEALRDGFDNKKSPKFNS
jgi:microcin C transport system permease protein